MEFPKDIRSALSAAWIRAYHYEHDHPLIFADPIAQRLLTVDEHSFFEGVFIKLLGRLDPALAASCSNDREKLRHFMRETAAPGEMLSRARYAEDKLEEAIAHSVNQYVLLGAGMESFAFRRRDLADNLRVFELDRPAAQAFKRRRIAEIEVEAAENLTFVAVDFAQTALDDALATSAFDPSSPAFFAWLGVTMYLDKQTLRKSLLDLRRVAAPGSGIVFDYLDADAFDHQKAARPIHVLIEHLDSIGEPMRTGFEPANLETELVQAGFRIGENLDPRTLNARYFKDRTDGYHATEQCHFAFVTAE